jgi:hypothetical protein
LKGILTYKIKGNTIIEVLIAMGILAFCSALAVVIYLNIQKSSMPFFKIKAVELAEFYMNKTIDEQNINEESFSAEEFTVKRTVSSINEYPDCYNIRILVFDGAKKKVHELEQVMYKTK